MGRRRKRAESAIDEVRDRATHAVDTVIDNVEEVLGGAKRRTRKGRRRIDRSAQKAERQLGRFWNRGRFRVRRVRGNATRRIDRGRPRQARRQELTRLAGRVWRTVSGHGSPLPFVPAIEEATWSMFR